MAKSLAVQSEAERSQQRRVLVMASGNSDTGQHRIPRNGLELPQRLPFEKWVAVGRQLSNVSSSSAWCLGDWMVYGEATYNGRYRDAIEQTSM